ncbi:hypothetical protein QBC35DRAFT_460846 [Podospora australis]|uniref:AA1-like domain-containing protein n=1 Tax=Podospora australis TaxID=1536484 RepID=A0AAN6WYI1_9PEZI|nr:hypothetical protein QBC35DRAFT_460846 [Podospora australis]
MKILAPLVLFTLQGALASPTLQHSKALPSCTIATATTTPNFILREYLLETIAGTNGSGGAQTLRGTLAVENPATGEIYRLYRIPISVGGGVWSVCRPGQDAPLPKELEVCQYLIERRSRRIGFRFKWVCGGDEEILFDATVIGELPEEVCVAKDGAEGGVVQTCTLPASVEGSLLLPVENISWEKVSAAGK